MTGEQPAREPGPRGGRTVHGACWISSFRACMWLLLWAMLMCEVEPSQRTARVGSPSCDLDLQVCVCMPSVVLSMSAFVRRASVRGDQAVRMNFEHYVGNLLHGACCSRHGGSQSPRQECSAALCPCPYSELLACHVHVPAEIGS